MQLNEHAVKAYNEKALGLLRNLVVRPLGPPANTNPTWRPDVHVAASVPYQDIRNLKTSRSDREGKEASKAFYHEGKTVEISGDGYQTLKRVAEGMQKTPDLRDSVSMSVLTSSIFDWIEARYKQVTTVSMTEYVLDQVKARIQEYEVWIPIAATRVQSSFEFGNMRIQTVTRAMLDQWETESRQTHPEASSALDVFFPRWRKAILGLAAATIQLRGEPQRAYELASAEAERTLALLRCLSHYSCFPFTVSNSVPLGQETPKGYQYFMTQEGRIAFSSSGFKGTPYDEWRIDNADLALMRSSLGMEKFSALLKEKKATSFQKVLLNALQLYGRSSTLKEPADKLSYIFASLEALLIADRTQSVNDLADRLVMFVDKAPAGRKDALRTIRTVYARRLSFVHSELTRQDLQTLEKFMVIVWTFFINVIGNANKYKSRLDFINAIDNLKLSGGLA